jgi:hypothetical protein
VQGQEKQVTEQTLKLPFITQAKNPQETLPPTAEIACVASMAEQQRKKPGFLRETGEKIVFISKIHYPIWAVALENQTIILDALGFASYQFTFKEPTKTAEFLETLKQTTLNPQDFQTNLKAQVSKTRELTTSTTQTFPTVIADAELLTFLPKYLQTATALPNEEEEKATVIPSEVNAQTAEETCKTVNNCLRNIQAHTKGLQYALQVLNEEVTSQKRSIANETQYLQEKCETEITEIRPEVEEKVEKLTLKHEKTLATLTKRSERQLALLQKKQDTSIRKLQQAENKKDAAENRVKKAKKTSSKSGAFELKRLEKAVDTAKKDVKAASEALEKARKETQTQLKQLDEEFKKAVQAEEAKITQLQTICDAKVADLKKQAETLTSQAASITSNLENLMDELKRSSAALRHQVLAEWKPTADLVSCHIPVYLIKYQKGISERFSLFAPTTIAEEVSVLSGIRKALTFSSEPRLKTLSRPTNKTLQDMLNQNLLEKMQSDPAFQVTVTAVCRANNLLDHMQFGETLNAGLDELTKREWLTTQEAAAICKQVMEEIT